MEATIVITVGRQVEGDYIFIKTEKGFTDAAKAQAFLQAKKSEFVQMDGTPQVIKITTPKGFADCICEVGVFTVDIE